MDGPQRLLQIKFHECRIRKIAQLCCIFQNEIVEGKRLEDSKS